MKRTVAEQAQADLVAHLRDLLERAVPVVRARIVQLDEEDADTEDEAALLHDISKALR